MAKTYVGQLYKNKVNVVAPKSVDMSEYANGRIPSYLSYQNNNVVNVTDILKNFPLPTWYTQYADQNGNFIVYEEPNQWYNKIYGVTSTWQLMFNGDSVTFITEGQYSNDSRISGIQGDTIRNITGSILISTLMSADSGSIYITHANNAYRNDVSSYGPYIFNFDASRVVPTSQVNRMRNRLIRVYHLLSVNGKPVSEIVAGV